MLSWALRPFMSSGTLALFNANPHPAQANWETGGRDKIIPPDLVLELYVDHWCVRLWDLNHSAVVPLEHSRTSLLDSPHYFLCGSLAPTSTETVPTQGAVTYPPSSLRSIFVSTSIYFGWTRAQWDGICGFAMALCMVVRRQWSWSSPPTTRILGVKLSLSGMAASIFNHQIISKCPVFYFQHVVAVYLPKGTLGILIAWLYQLLLGSPCGTWLSIVLRLSLCIYFRCCFYILHF